VESTRQAQVSRPRNLARRSIRPSYRVILTQVSLPRLLARGLIRSRMFAQSTQASLQPQARSLIRLMT
jgi:hypothetical protein